MHFLSLTARSVLNVSLIVFVSWIAGNKWIHVIPHAAAQEIPAELQGVGISEHLGEQISISELTFKDELGASVQLSRYFNKPVVFFFYYGHCKTICPYIVEGVVNSLKGLDWMPGNQFEVIGLSIDPRDSPEGSKRKKDAYLRNYGRLESAGGWHFLTGEETQIQKLASQLGFNYRYDSVDQQYAHSAALFVLTPQGKISRYLYGIEYPSKDLRFALLEASNGNIGTVADRLLLFCFRYDPQAKKYSVYLSRLMQVGGGSTVIIFGAYLASFWRRQRKGA